MKLGLHVGQLLQRVPGGIGRYVFRLLRALPEVGVTVVPFAAGDPSVHRVQRWDGYVDLGHPYPPWRYELWHRFRRPRLHLPVDLVHAPSLAVPPAGHRPLVVTVNDVAFLHHPESFTRRGIAFHRRGLEIARREAGAVVVPSQFTRDELLHEGFEGDRVFVATHGVQIPPEPAASETALRLRRVGVQAPFVVAVGTIEPRKGLPTLAAAVARARRVEPRLTLVLAGPRGWLEVRGLDGPGVRELGAIDDATLDALYRGAVACGIPSRYEGFGLPVLEAMARGCPVVASNAASLPEVVGDAGILVPAADITRWSDALISLLDAPERRQGFTERGRQRAVMFSWSASAKTHLEAYHAAFERGPRRP
jgi:glycosyltransferase involved in cell wall biosynthesis